MDSARTVAPLRGLTYSIDRFGGSSVPPRVRLPADGDVHAGRLADLTDLVCPPYDVIGDEDRRALLERHDRNAVRLELSPEGDPYAAAAETLAAWLGDGTLERAARPQVYYYAHARSSRPDGLNVQGVAARMLLEPWGGRVRPHERTLHGPKADRLALLRHTRTQLSPILAVYFDRSDRYRDVMSRAWSDEWRARDGDGLLHQLAAVEPDERLLGYLSRQRLYIADGHHRYETALAYQADVRSAPPYRDAEPGVLAADWVLAVLVNGADAELEIRPTHRLVVGLEEGIVAELPERAAERWELEAADPTELPQRVAAMSADPRPVVGVVMPGGRAWLLIGRLAEIGERMRSERGSTASRRLDLAILHATVFHDLLGIDVAAEGGGERILYTKDGLEAVSRASRGEVQAAFLVRPTRIDELAAVAGAGDLMPQKSTYFYPKLLTGMVFNPLEN